MNDHEYVAYLEMLIVYQKRIVIDLGKAGKFDENFDANARKLGELETALLDHMQMCMSKVLRRAALERDKE